MYINNDNIVKVRCLCLIIEELNIFDELITYLFTDYLEENKDTNR